MKICLAGAGGTGKTTIGKLLSAIYNIPFYEAPTRNIPPNLRKTIRGQILVCEEYLKKYEEWGDNFICTRSLFDPIAYSIIVGWDIKLVNEYIYYYLKQPYFPDLFIYLPIEFKLEADGEREQFEKDRKAVDSIIHNELNLYVRDYLTVTGTIEERLKQIKDAHIIK